MSRTLVKYKNLSPADQQRAVKRMKEMLAAGSDCSGCKGRVEDYQHFCMTCGTANPNFDEAVFLKEWGKPSAQYRTEECEKGHPGHQRTRSEAPEYVDKMPHCSRCGAKVLVSD